MAAYCVADRRWDIELGGAPGRRLINVVAETRPREEGFVSFANHLGGLLGDVALERERSGLELAHTLQAQFAHQVATEEHKKRLVVEHAIARLLSLDQVHKHVFEASRVVTSLTLSSLLALPFPVLEGPGWRVDEVHITTPAVPPYGIVLTVIDYNGRLCFNFNHWGRPEGVAVWTLCRRSSITKRSSKSSRKQLWRRSLVRAFPGPRCGRWPRQLAARRARSCTTSPTRTRS